MVVNQLLNDTYGEFCDIKCKYMHVVCIPEGVGGRLSRYILVAGSGRIWGVDRKGGKEKRVLWK